MNEALGVLKVEASAGPLDVASLHEAHADFVWRSLCRLGVREADADDMMQEVFVVVHRRLSTYVAGGKVTTWLFGICLRVAAAYRRRACNRREQLVGEAPDPWVSPDPPPDSIAEAREAQQRLKSLLDELDLEKRAIFVMFEIDEMPCDEIASLLGVAVGTVYSRLHAARKAFAAALGRLQAREARMRGF